MGYLEFREALLPFQVFSIKDVEKRFPDFDSRRLVEWQRKGYIQKLVNKWYLFNECILDERLIGRISNCIYSPSYISLESALAHYQIIPEAVYTQTSITTRKTISYTNSIGTFNYRSIKPELFFGYTILREGNSPVLMAELEKAILDYLYLNASKRSVEDIASLRFNYTQLHDSLNWQKLKTYQRVFDSKTIDKRIENLKSIFEHADVI